LTKKHEFRESMNELGRNTIIMIYKEKERGRGRREGDALNVVPQEGTGYQKLAFRS
jgi:hypothetical protein